MENQLEDQEKQSQKQTNKRHYEDMDEPMLQDSGMDRFIIFPIRYADYWVLYKRAMSNIWFAEELILSDDLNDWKYKLNDNERYYIKNVLAFFASSDGIVNENLALRFMGEVTIPEARFFYGSQIMIENIHAETYSLLIDTYIRDANERINLFNAVNNIDVIRKKAEWALKYISSNEQFAVRLVAFAAVEGIFFSGSFCAIFWLKKRGLMPGLCFSNELIARDEALHCEFAYMLYNDLVHKLSQEKILEIIQSAVELEIEFCKHSLPVRLIGMNSDLMTQYLQFVADRTLICFGCPKYYKVLNPFDFMELISLQGKSNFFERQVSEYKRAGLMSNLRLTRNNNADETNRTQVHDVLLRGGDGTQNSTDNNNNNNSNDKSETEQLNQRDRHYTKQLVMDDDF